MSEQQNNINELEERARLVELRLKSQIESTADNNQADLDAIANRATRQRVTNVVLWLLSGTLFMIGITAFARAARWLEGEDPLPIMIELLKIAVIPITTLVLGYYFGARR